NFGDQPNSFLVRLATISFLAPEKESALKTALETALGGTPDKPLFRKDGGFLLEGGRVELGLSKEAKTEDIAKVFAAQGIPLRRGVENVDATKNEYVVRFKLGDMSKEQFQKAKEAFKAKFQGVLTSEDIEMRRDRATLVFNKQVSPAEIEKALED